MVYQLQAQRVPLIAASVRLVEGLLSMVMCCFLLAVAFGPGGAAGVSGSRPWAVGTSL